jgi:hypothetical protein
VTDFLDEKRKEIDARLKELRPLVEEYERLEKAASALAGVGASSPGRGGRRSSVASAGRRPGSGGGGRGRPRGSGKRARQAQELVGAQPGITIPELADAMGIQANYLYRVMPALQAEGKIRKEGKGWHPAADWQPS